MNNTKAILWLDLETTGSTVEFDYIMEIGAVMTDFNFEELGQSYSETVYQPPEILQRVYNNPVVEMMHSENGLLSACKNTLPFDYDEHFVSWIRSIVPKGRVILAGSGVGHFDRKFVAKYMWRTDALLTYPTLDIGVVRRYLKYIGFIPQPEDNYIAYTKSHRALDDIRQHLDEARRYKRLLVQSEVLND